MANWKTTLGGILISLGTILQSSESTWSSIGTIMVAVGGLLAGASARDWNVTSERSGAQ